jgi:hypothetical protein
MESSSLVRLFFWPTVGEGDVGGGWEGEEGSRNRRGLIQSRETLPLKQECWDGREVE